MAGLSEYKGIKLGDRCAVYVYGCKKDNATVTNISVNGKVTVKRDNGASDYPYSMYEDGEWRKCCSLSIRISFDEDEIAAPIAPKPMSDTWKRSKAAQGFVEYVGGYLTDEQKEWLEGVAQQGDYGTVLAYIVNAYKGE